MAGVLFYKYIWLIETIYNHPNITFKEINFRWQNNKSVSGGALLPNRTFHNYRETIQNIFDITISCYKPINGYYIEDPEGITDNTIRKKLFNTFSFQLNLHEVGDLGKRIEFENIYSKENLLPDILKAMKENRVLNIVYHNFWKQTITEREVAPYMLKIFKQRWYLIANEIISNKIKVFALDRIQSLQETKETFLLPETFIPENFFADCYGIVNDSSIKSEQILLKVYGAQVHYFREVPLHPSQKEMETTGNYSVFSYRIKPTYDLRREIQYKGNEVEILEPAWFREEIRNELKKAFLLYE